MIDKLPTRIQEKIKVQDRGYKTPCWVWTGYIRRGYGMVHWNGDKKAHRVVYELLVGPLPSAQHTGLEPDHLCRVTKCVNPDHLEVVTHRENSLRGDGFGGVNARKTHCIHGHSLEDAYETKTPTGIKRTCRTCQKQWRRDSYVRNGR